MRQWIGVMGLVLIPAFAWGENLVVRVETVQSTPTGYRIGYTATPASSKLTYANVVDIPYSASNQQINGAIVNDAKTVGTQEFGLIIGPSDTVKVFGGPSN